MAQVNAAAKEFEQIQAAVERLTTSVVDQMRALQQASRDLHEGELTAIVHRDREIDALEMSIDRMARSFMELRAPLGPDFRYMMTVLDIARNLERIGDCIEYTARHVRASLAMPKSFPEAWAIILTMQDKCRDMLEQAYAAWQKSDARLAERLPRQDEEVDKLQKQVRTLMVQSVRAAAVDVELGLQAVLIANKLESIADISSHIAESVVFVIQARQIRHEKRKVQPPMPTPSKG